MHVIASTRQRRDNEAKRSTLVGRSAEPRGKPRNARSCGRYGAALLSTMPRLLKSLIFVALSCPPPHRCIDRAALRATHSPSLMAPRPPKAEHRPDNSAPFTAFMG
jgi:hypothetical protein